MEWKTKSDQQNRIVKAPTPSAQARGQLAEEHAGAWLAARGLKILARNVRCRGGELDLICLERDTLVFVEVRLRTNSRFGCAAESITSAKRRRIIFAAKWWLIRAGRAYRDRPCRFDAVLFDNGLASEPQWIRGAFEGK
ncbi:MAG: YraN family protein [Betaproteobacteria bacterium]|nr:YraN family protein [Betaproteobacteria bacterium]